jgi:glycosyltransferase involved in cell wall biosynthesis
MEQVNSDHHENGAKGTALKSDAIIRFPWIESSELDGDHIITFDVSRRYVKLKKFDRSVSLLCWAYNEQDSILGFLAKASRLMDESVIDYEIVLVDDGSTDLTALYADRFAFDHPHLRVRIVKNRRNLNVGLSCRHAILCASKEFLFWQTVDWAYDISNLRAYLELLKIYDIVQGVRPGGFHVKRSDSIGKAIISFVNYWMIHFLYRVPLHDFQNVTFYPTKWVQSIVYESTTSFVNPEGLIKSYWAGKSIIEVPIGFMPRVKGKAKGTKLGFVLRSMRDVLKFWLKWVVFGKEKALLKWRI